MGYFHFLFMGISWYEKNENRRHALPNELSSEILRSKNALEIHMNFGKHHGDDCMGILRLRRSGIIE